MNLKKQGQADKEQREYKRAIIHGDGEKAASRQLKSEGKRGTGKTSRQLESKGG